MVDASVDLHIQQRVAGLLYVQATVVGDQVNGPPHFFGAEPATVLEGPALPGIRP